jgi:two-component system cell cycle sensor histidine kinase/response regulator CckA
MAFRAGATPLGKQGLPGAGNSIAMLHYGQMTGPGTQTILVVDDEASVVAVTKIILTRQGFDVLAARTPDEAMRIVAERLERRISLILCDFVLPDMNGVELVRQIHKLCPDVRVLYFSAYSEHEELRPLILRGVPYLSKPYTADQLIAKVREALDGPKSQAAEA